MRHPTPGTWAWVLRQAAHESGVTDELAATVAESLFEAAKLATWKLGRLVLPNFVTLHVRKKKAPSGAVSKATGSAVKARVSRTWRAGNVST